jgi:uncharacterized membrane-anchored protein
MNAHLLALALLLPAPGRQEALSEPQDSTLVETGAEDPFGWIEGPGEGLLGTRARIDVPVGFRFTGGEGTRLLLEMNQNPTSGRELGLIAADDEPWFVVFEFDEAGYVQDEDRDELDAGALIEVLREGNERGNELRRQRGWETLELLGWKREPFYDERTNNLTWATHMRAASGGESVNWSVRVLGRKGVMNVDLVLGPEGLDAALPKFEALLDTFEYTDGERYAQFTAGDKIAEYGLAALIVGGGAAVAAKAGLFQKLLKPLLIGLAAVAAFGKKIWGWITGRSKAQGEAEAR